MAPSVLDKIRSQVDSLSPDQIREQLVKLQAQKEKQKAYRVGKELSPEQREKRKAYNKERLAKPGVKDKMKEYRTRPEVKEKMTEYRKRRYQFQKALIARAKELGITA
jgi:hypothetical protein